MFPRSAVEGSVADRWRSVVDGAAAGPGATGRTALRAGPVRLTHGELDRRARALAAALVATPATPATPSAPSSPSAPSAPDRADPEEPVAVLTSHDESVVVAVLGVLLSGRPLVVLDAKAPPARLSSVVAASGARRCVTGRGWAGTAEELSLVPVPVDQPAVPADLALPRPDPGATATVLFTSGSTGSPQGVAYSHRAVLHDAWQRAESGAFRPEDTFALVLPVAFAFGSMELLSALLVGAAVTVHDPRAGGLEAVLREVAGARASVLSGTPSLLRAVADVPGAAGLLPLTLRGVRSAGERLLTADAAAVTAVLPDGCTLVNTMGSSETGALTEYLVDPAVLAGSTSVPLGWPVEDLYLRVEREDGSPAGTGEPGELAVVSRYLPTGYWRDPAGTTERYEDAGDGRRRVGTRDRVRRREDGCLELVGRMGLVVKVRGHRVDPAEVEAALLSADGVTEAVVVGHAGDDGGGRGSRTRLVAHVVPAKGATLRPSELRAHVRALLPAAMVPDVVVLLPALPRTERGKVDRTALPAPAPGAAGGYAEARGDWERVLMDMWGFVLEVDGVGRHDDFFALGGDSLDVEHLLSRLEDQLGVQAEAADVAAAPTVAQFALLHPYRRTSGTDHHRRVLRRVRDLRSAPAGPPPLVPVDVDEDVPRLFCLAGAGGLGLAFLPLARRLAGTAAVHALQAHRLETGGVPDWTVARAVRRHAAAIRAVQPHGPYHLAGHSMGGLLAVEVAHLLRTAGEEVPLLLVVDSYAPGHHPPVPSTRWRVRARTAVGLALTGLQTRDERGHFSRFRRQGIFLSRRIAPRPWDGPALVLVAADDPGGGRDLGWEECLTGPWRMQEVPGTHLTVLREPSAGVVAGAVSRALAAQQPSVAEDLGDAAHRRDPVGAQRLNR